MKHIRWISLLVLMTSQALAQDVTITGNMEISIPRSSSGGLKSAAQVNRLRVQGFNWGWGMFRSWIKAVMAPV